MLLPDGQGGTFTLTPSASANFVQNRTTFVQENPTTVFHLDVPITSSNGAEQPVLFNRDALGFTYQVRGCQWQSITTQVDVTDVTQAGIHLALKIDNATGDIGAASFAKGVIANNQITWTGAITDTWTFHGTLIESGTFDFFAGFEWGWHADCPHTRDTWHDLGATANFQSERHLATERGRANSH